MSIFDKLLDAADLSPDTGEGGKWDVRNGIAHDLRRDYDDCKARGDEAGATDCIRDAFDYVREWRDEAVTA